MFASWRFWMGHLRRFYARVPKYRHTAVIFLFIISWVLSLFSLLGSAVQARLESGRYSPGAVQSARRVAYIHIYDVSLATLFSPPFSFPPFFSFLRERSSPEADHLPMYVHLRPVDFDSESRCIVLLTANDSAIVYPLPSLC